MSETKKVSKIHGAFVRGGSTARSARSDRPAMVQFAKTFRMVMTTP